jgi:flagellin
VDVASHNAATKHCTRAPRGSDNLVLAYTNAEGASLLALQTRLQLSVTALSLANQTNQAVLRLLG